MTDFTTITACGECCTGCSKKLAGTCPGCIESDGRVPEWAESGRCRVHACARDHGVQFCGLCDAFPCDKLPEMIPWNPDIIRHLSSLRDEYLKQSKHSDRTEKVELTVLCLIQDGDKILLQNRVKDDWKGYTLPGGHVEPGESFVDAVIREMKEETGLDIINPKLSGIKQFPIEGGRYIVLLFKADQFSGEVISSQEGKMEWIDRRDISKINAVDDLCDLLRVIEDPELTEFQYIVEGDKWRISLR